MASNRHLGRIIALQTLYERDFRADCGDKSLKLSEILDRNINRYSSTVDDVDFVRVLVNGVEEQGQYIDSLLQPIAPDWPLDQIARVDRIILRLGAYELLFQEDAVPSRVSINEAVELAKSFGGENSSKFINGVLGTLIKQKEADTLPKNK
ncbi:MAG: transcription antitermination factor NusB [Candidatus Nomurabacteria bacterium]|nr:transcription antitermination factor NusB [Candidatus Saccharibacteria bacterium]USN95357.1 MAG: transcription antitermination factor NusB [Candidatus Nomurabacteria bacterium]